VEKLTETITFKVSARLKIQLEDKAIDEGINISDLCRKWVIQSLHNSNFRMKDYLRNGDEEQEK
jgi:hypothetical protein